MNGARGPIQRTTHGTPRPQQSSRRRRIGTEAMAQGDLLPKAQADPMKHFAARASALGLARRMIS